MPPNPRIVPPSPSLPLEFRTRSFSSDKVEHNRVFGVGEEIDSELHEPSTGIPPTGTVLWPPLVEKGITGGGSADISDTPEALAYA